MRYRLVVRFGLLIDAMPPLALNQFEKGLQREREGGSLEASVGFESRNFKMFIVHFCCC